MGRLDEIHARVDAATPEPWLTPTERVKQELPKFDSRDTNEIVDHEGCGVWPWLNEADMIFAYKAREDVPWLLARVRELEAGLAWYADQDNYLGHCPAAIDDLGTRARATLAGE